MGQQSQAQAQAQISALQQQNAMLNQHLHSQAQAHINHLQQLIPFHQPPQPFQPSSASYQSTPQTPVPQTPDPQAPTATPASQSGPTAHFNPDEMLQQMKSTVESSIQAMVEKTQAQSTPPQHLPTAAPVLSTSHHPSTVQRQLPRQRSSRRSSRRSRSHHHGSPTRRPDKRPASIRRSPRRRCSSRRYRRSSRDCSHSRSHSHHRHNSPRRERESSITLRSASPRRDDRQPPEEYHQPPEYSSKMPTLQASPWWKNQHSTEYYNPQGDNPEQSSDAKWGTRKNYSKNPSSKYQSTWKDPRHSSSHHDTFQQHFPHPSPQPYATRRKSLILQVMINHKCQSPSLLDICSSIFATDQKQNGYEESNSV